MGGWGGQDGPFIWPGEGQVLYDASAYEVKTVLSIGKRFTGFEDLCAAIIPRSKLEEMSSVPVSEAISLPLPLPEDADPIIVQEPCKKPAPPSGRRSLTRTRSKILADENQAKEQLDTRGTKRSAPGADRESDSEGPIGNQPRKGKKTGGQATVKASQVKTVQARKPTQTKKPRANRKPKMDKTKIDKSLHPLIDAFQQMHEQAQHNMEKAMKSNAEMISRQVGEVKSNQDLFQAEIRDRIKALEEKVNDETDSHMSVDTASTSSSAPSGVWSAAARRAMIPHEQRQRRSPKIHSKSQPVPDWRVSLPADKRGSAPRIPLNAVNVEEFEDAKMSIIIKPVRPGLFGESATESPEDLAAGVLTFFEEAAGKNKSILVGKLAKFFENNVVEGSVRRLTPQGEVPTAKYPVRFRLKTPEAYNRLMAVKPDLKYGYTVSQAYPEYARALWSWQRDRAHVFRNFYKKHGYTNEEMRARIILDGDSSLPVLQVRMPGESSFQDINHL